MPPEASSVCLTLSALSWRALRMSGLGRSMQGTAMRASSSSTTYRREGAGGTPTSGLSHKGGAFFSLMPHAWSGSRAPTPWVPSLVQGTHALGALTYIETLLGAHRSNRRPTSREDTSWTPQA